MRLLSVVALLLLSPPATAEETQPEAAPVLPQPQAPVVPTSAVQPQARPAPAESQLPNWYPPYQASPPPPPGASGYTTTPAGAASFSAPVAGYAPLDDRPNILEYDSSKPIPPGYTVEKRSRKGLLISGAVTFSLSYLLSAAWASASDEDGGDKRITASLLYIPVLGPWLAIPTAHNGCSDSSCKNDRKNAITGVVILGTAQVVGATLLAFGFVPSKRLVRTDLTVAPVFIGKSGYGVGLSGTL